MSSSDSQFSVSDEDALPATEGLFNEIARFALAQASHQIHKFAIAAALGLMAGICGRAWNTPAGDGLNDYFIVVGKPSVGKDSIHKAIATLIDAAAEIPGLPGNSAKDIEGFFGP